jgi:hypothetical protein
VSGHGRARTVALILAVGAAAAAPAAEPVACLSADPTQWPAVHKPYVLVIASTAASMTGSLGGANNCDAGTTVRDHVRCALRHAFETYSGTAHFGLATFARVQNSTCTVYSNFTGNAGLAGCGPEPGANSDSSTRQGANIVIPIEADEVNVPVQVSNANGLSEWVDNQCDSGAETFANGSTTLNGSLRDAYRYFSNQWTRPDGGPTFTTPLGANDLTCRRLRVVLITAGDEACDTQLNAVDAAADLFAGFTFGGRTFRVTTSVIALPGTTQSDMDAIASAGGTGAAFVAANDTQISNALANIMSGLLSPETCDGQDNDCNGCSDEGFRHYGNTDQTCCSWSTVPQRTACLTNYRASISAADPDGNLALLPCTTAIQAQEPATWLCFDPKETCDNADNNLDGLVDEGQVKCGTPPHCPQTEVCNGADDNCDGSIDEGCPGGPVAIGPEICDGCDNDGDSVADNGVMAIPCGQSSPGNCVGVLTCKPAQPVPFPGACAIGGGLNACSYAPQGEVCDGVDNDCDGVVDDGIAGVACEPAGTPPGLRYGGNSQCRMGVQHCGQPCLGFVGPTPEVTDLIDNDCNGVAEDGLDLIFEDGFEP